MNGLGPKIPHRVTQLFFFAGSNFSINKDLDGHDRSSVMSQCNFKFHRANVERSATESKPPILAAPIWPRISPPLVLLIVQNPCSQFNQLRMRTGVKRNLFVLG